MENFEVYNPTHVYFGKDVINKLGECVAGHGKNVLLMYGKGSIKKYGIYDQVIPQLKSVNANIVEYSGIKSNPVIEDVDKAIKLGINKKCDVILAVGGGSVIDSAKIVSVGMPGNYKGWDIMKGLVEPTNSIPLVTVLTLAATGSEMNNISVMQSHTAEEKIGYHSDLIYPVASFLDPVMTMSVPRKYTTYGVVDLITHCFESFFGDGEATLADKFVEAIVKEAITFGPKLLNDLHNYELRAKIMWAATNALNGLTNYGRRTGDWGVHSIGHILSLLYDVPHGASLSIAYPAWLKLHTNRIPERIGQLGRAVFGTGSMDDTIENIEDLFQKLEAPIKLSELGFGKEVKEEIRTLMNKNKTSGYYHKLYKDEHEVLVELMY